MRRAVRILYDIRHADLVDGAERNLREVSAEYGIEIKADYSYLTRKLFEYLRDDPNYDFIVIHLGRVREDLLYSAFREADGAKRLAENAVIVAESSVNRVDRDHLIREHFDECVYPPISYRKLPDGRTSLRNLLRKYGFIQ
jgi:hypothetical protein